jgi:hypothetical protein
MYVFFSSLGKQPSLRLLAVDKLSGAAKRLQGSKNANRAMSSSTVAQKHGLQFAMMGNTSLTKVPGWASARGSQGGLIVIQ